jgi:hypothetical protein
MPPDMSTFAIRRFLLVASMLFCQVALADDQSKEPAKQAAATAKEPTSTSTSSVLADPVQPEEPFKLLAALKPVSMQEVDRVIEASDRAVQSCNRNPRRPDTLAVLMTITIDGEGKVTDVQVAPESEDKGKAPPEASCLAKVAKKLKFSATGTVTHVSYPFMIVSRIKPTAAY